WNHELSYVGLSKELQDIRLQLDQLSKVEHVKVPLVVHTTVELHEFDRVIWEFWFRKRFHRHPKTSNISLFTIGGDKGRQRHMRRLRRMPRNPRFGVVIEANEDNFDDDIYADYVSAPMKSSYFLPLVYETQYTYTPMLVVSHAPPGSLFYQGGSSSQPLVHRIEKTRCQPKSRSQSTMDGSEEEGGGDDEDEEEEQLEPQFERRRNSSCDRRPLHCGTHSAR
ncbi:hypothetical protein Goshw_003199, partial [Gossypium schwendimanii]|nr:hypothetical protein [Gossypium schwendimanii]